MDGKSLDTVATLKEQLSALIPEAFAEGKIDWEKLKAVLGEDINFSNERYVLNWAGKSDAFKVMQTPTTKTLVPAKDESVNFDETENIFIEGENLEVLKTLQKSYFGKIKMIYIDPPYNTGNDSFIYPDKFSETKEEYQKRVGDKDEEGYMTKDGMFHKNSKENGQYHSNWLNMMYPRLFMAKNLLTEDGVIFVSIDDNEVHNLRLLMNEIFGEENFLSQFIWNSEGNTDNQLEVKIKHEYILCYLKSYHLKEAAIGHVVDPSTTEESNLWKGYADNNINKNNPENPPNEIELPAGFPSTEETLIYEKKNLDDDFFKITKEEKYISDEVKEKYKIEKKSGLPVKLDQMVIEDSKLKNSCRIYGGFANANKLKQFIQNGMNPILDDDGAPISFYINKNAAVRYRKEVEKPRNILSVLRNLGTTEKNKTELKKMGVFFSYPKPVDLIKYLIQIGAEEDNSIVLDFFSGSGTVGHAILDLNKADNGNRKFICVQLPEHSDKKSEAYKAGYETIADISKERIRRVIQKINEEQEGQLDFSEGKQDLGFKVFKLSESNFKQWQDAIRPKPKSAEELAEQMKLFVNPINGEPTNESMAFELLLKSGLNLNSSIAEKEGFYLINENELALVLEETNESVFSAIATHKTSNSIRYGFQGCGWHKQ